MNIRPLFDPSQSRVIIPDDDMWNPTTWLLEEYEYRIYGNTQLTMWAVVDREDYAWASQWCWSPLRSRGKADKFYLRRTITIPIGKDWTCEHTGKRMQNRRTENLFLHTAVMERMGVKPPSKKHTIIGHLDDDQFNCRRSNLKWLTVSENNSMAYKTGKRIHCGGRVKVLQGTCSE